MLTVRTIRDCRGVTNSLLLRSRPSTLLQYRLATRVSARNPGLGIKGIASGHPKSRRNAAKKPEQESLVRQIHLPGSRKGIKASQEARNSWARGWKESSGQDPPLPESPLILLIDLDPRSETQLSPNGIKFAHNDPLGRKLWRIANPIPWSARPRVVRWTVYGVVLYYSGLFLLWVYYQENEPITGRWRFNWISPSKWAKLQQQERSQIDREVEALRKSLFPEDNPWIQTLKSVLARLTIAAGLDDMEWQLHLVNAPDIANASVSSTGQVIVYSGILAAVNQTVAEDEIATILGHEMAHVIAGHSMEARSNKSLSYWFLAPFAPFILGAFVIQEFNIVAAPLGLIASILLLALSRGRESEADYIGMLLMAQAGFDPNGAVTFWHSMNEITEEQKKKKPKARTQMELLSTHPHKPARIKQNSERVEVLSIVGRMPISAKTSRHYIDTLAKQKGKWVAYLETQKRRKSSEFA